MKVRRKFYPTTCYADRNGE